MRMELNPRRAFVLGILMVPLLLSLFAAPAFAAQKVINVRVQNVTFTGPLGFFTFCGVTDTFTFREHFNQFSFVQWDNGHFVLTFTHNRDFFDSSGIMIVRGRHTTHEVAGEGTLPFTFQFNDVHSCTGKSPTPGKLAGGNFHTGLTIGEDGNIKEVHVVAK